MVAAVIYVMDSGAPRNDKRNGGGNDDHQACPAVCRPDCSAVLGPPSERAILSQPADPDGRVLPAGRRDRRHRAHHRRAARAASRPERRGRQPPGLERQHLRRACRQRAARRPYPAARLRQPVRRQSASLFQNAGRPAQGVRAGHQSRDQSPDPDRQSRQGAVEDARGIHRVLAQGQSAVVLRVDRQWQPASHRDGVAEADRQRRPHPCALQGWWSRRHRDGRRRDGRHVRRRIGGAAGPLGQAARAGGQQQGALADVAGSARHRRDLSRLRGVDLAGAVRPGRDAARDRRASCAPKSRRCCACRTSRRS